MVRVTGDCSRSDCPLHERDAPPVLPEALKKRLADAYALQSRSDFEVYRTHLSQAEECHRLHYLQMSCEKIAKAYRLRDTRAFLDNDLYSHVAFSRFVSNFLKSPALRRRYQAQDAKRRHMERYARRLSAEIERLAPAVDRGRTPLNAEYPWTEGDAVFIPCRHTYPLSALLKTPGGRDFLKLVEIAIEDYHLITLIG